MLQSFVLPVHAMNMTVLQQRHLVYMLHNFAYRSVLSVLLTALFKRL